MVTKAEQNEQDVEESKQEAPVKFELSHTHHTFSAVDSYSVSINFENCKTTMDTFPWTRRMGYHIDLSIFDLQVSDIKALGEALITEALKIKLGKEAETPA